jgi:protein involved in polysaccharide export with SLBB domain
MKKKQGHFKAAAGCGLYSMHARWLTVIFCVLLTACSSKPPRAIPYSAVAGGGGQQAVKPGEAGTPQGRDYRIGLGDSLDLFVVEDPTFNENYTVRVTGDIVLSKVGRIPVLGLSLTEAEKVVASRLEVDQLKKATVVIDPVGRGGSSSKGGQVSAGLTIFLTGRLNKTGRVMVPFVGNSQVTAYQAVADCGGFAPFANKRKGVILRKLEHDRPPLRIPVDFQKVEEGTLMDPVLRDGDVILVPEKMFGF